MNCYDVALWRWFDRELPIVVDAVASSSPLLAALYVMQFYHVKLVQHVAVSCPDGSIWRYDRLALSEEHEVYA